MIRTVLIYAVVLALAAFALEWLDFKRVTREFAAEIYIVLIATGFAALGVWVGAQLMPRRPAEPFEQNTAALKSLGLTPREISVLELIAAGQSNKEIARTLGVSPNTVKTHAANLYEKLGVTRRTGAVDAARRLALLP
ncbi:MAG: response regulator transcription factor [Maricaulaceae bacterium]|jgi:DNA-binding CsgD family transcriptional regulator